MPRAGQVLTKSHTYALLQFLKQQTAPLASCEIAQGTGQVASKVNTRLFELCAQGHVAKLHGKPTRYYVPGVVDPALIAEATVATHLPVVRAALPTDRSLRPHVGVVMLLDQPRRAA